MAKGEPPDGPDQLPAEGLVHLFAQPAHPRLDDVRAGVEVVLPDVLHDRGPGDDAAAVAHEVFEQLVFERLEVDADAGAEDLAGPRVELEVPDPERGLLGDGRGAAQEGAHAGQELRHGEGLGEVVVAARLQAVDLVLDGAERAQDDDGKGLSQPPDLPDERETVPLRKQDVDDGDVEVPDADAVQRLLAVARDDRGEAVLAEGPFDKIGGLGVVLDDQDVHAGHSRRAVRRCQRIRPKIAKM